MNTTACQPNGMLSHLSTDKCVHNIIDEVLFYVILIEKMLREYNFIGVQELMYESFISVNIKILLNYCWILIVKLVKILYY